MLISKDQKRAAEEISSSSNVIGKGTVLEGNIETQGNLRVEGRIIGNIKSKAKVVLGNSSHVEGNVVSQNADIEGEVKGKVDVTELLSLKATAVVHGDISTGKLMIEAGAIFNGSCKMGTMKDIKFAEPTNLNTNAFAHSQEAR